MKIPLKIGQSIQMLVPTAAQTVPCQVTVQSLESNQFCTSLPQGPGIEQPLNVHYVIATVSMSDAIYTMKCPVLDTSKGFFCIAIPPAEQIHLKQRREFVRIPSDIPCSLELDFDGSSDFMPPAPAQIKDISGGGCAVLFAMELPVGSGLRLTFDLPGEGNMVLMCKVKRCSHVISEHGSQYLSGLEFLGIDGENRGKLVWYVLSTLQELQKI